MIHTTMEVVKIITKTITDTTIMEINIRLKETLMEEITLTITIVVITMTEAVVTTTTIGEVAVLLKSMGESPQLKSLRHNPVSNSHIS